MKYFFFSIFLSLSISLQASEIFKYTLQKNQKFEKTFSVNISKDATLHMVIVKNKSSKLYDLIPFYMDASNIVKELETASFKDIPDIISYHKINDNITLLSHQDETLDILDFNINNGKHTKNSIENFKNPETVFIQDEQSIILKYDSKNNSFSIINVKDAESITTKEVAIPNELQKSLKEAFKDNPEVIKTNEFVKNGSISATQLYFENEKFHIIKGNDKLNSIETILLDPNATKPLTSKTYTSDKIEKIKNKNSHVIDNKLFSLMLGDNDFNLNIYDLNSGEQIKSFLLSEEVGQLQNIRSKKGKFLKDANSLKMKSTISVNKTNNGDFAIILDNVNKNSYTYDNNWFWLHNMMFQQQMMLNQTIRPGGFGPNPKLFNYDEYLLFVVKSTQLKFVINNKYELIAEANPETIHQYIDTEKHMKSLSGNKNLHNTSAGFLENEYRYIYTDKKEKTVFIKTRPIKRRVKPTRN